jgi:hypothetical protein
MGLKPPPTMFTLVFDEHRPGLMSFAHEWRRELETAQAAAGGNADLRSRARLDAANWHGPAVTGSQLRDLAPSRMVPPLLASPATSLRPFTVPLSLASESAARHPTELKLGNASSAVHQAVQP